MRYSNFEAQKGKTKLDSHYATLKCSLGQYRKKKHDVLCGDDIMAGRNGRLRGTHVYSITINREVEPQSAKTLSGISQYGDFEYIDAGIMAREQTKLGCGKLFTNQQLDKLIKENAMGQSTSATTNLNI